MVAPTRDAREDGGWARIAGPALTILFVLGFLSAGVVQVSDGQDRSTYALPLMDARTQVDSPLEVDLKLNGQDHIEGFIGHPNMAPGDEAQGLTT